MMSLFFGACARYQFEFVPALALLASVGIMGIESSWRGGFRSLARCAWVAALVFSSAFTVLYGIERCASDHNISGITCLAYGDFPGAQHEFENARFLSPRNPVSRLGTGLLLALQGRAREAHAALAALAADFPDYAMAHFALGNVLAGEGMRDEATAQLREAHELDPDDATIKAALDSALARGK